MADSRLTRTISSAGSLTTWTFSTWIKRSVLGDSDTIMAQGSSGDNFMEIHFDGNDCLDWRQYVSGAYQGRLHTDRMFRDTSAWYNIVCQWDTTNGTAGDRMKMWINGVQETSFQATTNPTSSRASIWNSTTGTMNIGSAWNAAYYFNGYQSHTAFVNNAIVAPTVFGSTDSTSGIWKFKSPAPTWGTNGFHLKYENSGNLGLDSSGQSNTFTVAGSLRQALDTPSNVYCTMNPLQATDAGQSAGFSFGNTKVVGNWSHWQRVFGTLGATKGKWFYEFKNLQNDGSAGHCRIGWDSIDFINYDSSGQSSYYSGLTLDREGKLRGGIGGYSGYSPNAVQMTAISGGNFSYTANDILGMAIDLDNETFSVYKNGTLEINAYSYAGLSNNSISKSRGFFIGPSWNWYSTSGNNNRSCFNFGNGHFESTAITSAGSNGNGSLFEYDVPSGYYAWNTKNINTYG
tara:strand:- start:1080 stop:2456 length:1377 start_codon:yes stop_codon:yes gene_type:complete